MATEQLMTMSDPNGGYVPTISWWRDRLFGKHSGPRNVPSQSHFSGHEHQGRMNRLFVSTTLIASLSFGSLAQGQQASSIDPKSADSVKVFALDWFARLQAGEIDRTQMTRDLSKTLTEDSVEEMARHLKSYGPANGDEIIQNRRIEDQTFYVVKLFLERGDALSLLIGFDDGGKVTVVTFPSMGQE